MIELLDLFSDSGPSHKAILFIVLLESSLVTVILTLVKVLLLFVIGCITVGLDLICSRLTNAGFCLMNSYGRG